jgi:hypothetical protein
MAKCYWQSLISVVFFLSCASFSSPAFSESLDIDSGSGVSRSSKKCVRQSTENCKKNSNNGQKKTNRSGSEINQGKPSGTNNSSKRRRSDDSANNSDRKSNQGTNSVSRKNGKKPAFAKSGDTQTNLSGKKRRSGNNVNKLQEDIDLKNQSPEPNNQPTPQVVTQPTPQVVTQPTPQVVTQPAPPTQGNNPPSPDTNAPANNNNCPQSQAQNAGLFANMFNAVLDAAACQANNEIDRFKFRR